MEYPLITIIIPIYNVSKYLVRCINSVISQSYKNLEILLIDDGSTDESGIICDRYKNNDSRIRVFHNNNAGRSSSRNFGLINACGEYISFVDGDDWISESFIELLYEAACADNYDISFCDWYFSFPDKNILYESFCPTGIKKNIMTDYIIEGYHVVWNKLYKKSLLDKYHLAFPNHIQKFEEDTWFTIRAMFYAEKIAKVSLPLYYYNQTNPTSITNYSRSIDGLTTKLLVYKDTLDFFSELKIADDYKAPIYWRVLQGKSLLILDPVHYPSFNLMLPEANRYILNNPLLGWKMKIMMWLVAHRLGMIAKGLLTISRFQ